MAEFVPRIGAVDISRFVHVLRNGLQCAAVNQNVVGISQPEGDGEQRDFDADWGGKHVDRLSCYLGQRVGDDAVIFVQLIIPDEKAVIRARPALMGVGGVGIAESRD